MPNTTDWIRWSTDFAKPYWNINHQQFLEVAGFLCRYYRMNGMSADQALANADHYWLSRLMCFWCAGGAGDIAATPVEALSPTVAQLAGRIGSLIGSMSGGVVYSLVGHLWHLYKLLAFAVGRPDLIIGGEGPASEPTSEQLQFMALGIIDSQLRDMPYADQMRWGFVAPALERIPPPPT